MTPRRCILARVALHDTLAHGPATRVTVSCLDAEGRKTSIETATAAVLITIDSRTLQWTITVQLDGTVQASLTAREGSTSQNSRSGNER